MTRRGGPPCPPAAPRRAIVQSSVGEGRLLRVPRAKPNGALSLRFAGALAASNVHHRRVCTTVVPNPPRAGMGPPPTKDLLRLYRP